MAYCEQCGSELKEGAKFCENCGASVAAPVVVPEPVAEQPAAVRNTPEQESAAKTAMILGIIGLALAETGIPGIILCAIAKSRVKKATQMGAAGAKLKVGRILSNVGLAISIVMTIVWLLYMLVMGVAMYAIIDEGGFINSLDMVEDMFY